MPETVVGQRASQPLDFDYGKLIRPGRTIRAHAAAQIASLCHVENDNRQGVRRCRDRVEPSLEVHCAGDGGTAGGRPLTSRILVISGGQLILTGMPTVPIPLETYIREDPIE